MSKRTPSKINREADLNLLRRIARESRSETLARLHASAEGLSTKQAEVNREEFGDNDLGKQRQGYGQLLVKAVVTPFNLVLLFLAIFSFFSDYFLAAPTQKNLTTSLLMLLILLVSAAAAFIQDYRARKLLSRLLNAVSVTTNIKRDGQNQELPTRQVVVGDIINLSAGDIVPADLRLIQSKDLFCSAASVSGESKPIEKIATRTPKIGRKNDYLHYPNILYEGTTVVSGSGSGVVFATGQHTALGRLVKRKVPGNSRQNKFNHDLSLISRFWLAGMLVLLLLLLVINGLTKHDWSEALLFAVVAAVGLAPQFLPAVASSNLLKGAAQMSRLGTVVKNVASIQDMAAVDTICTDKTGTLTQGQVALERHFDLEMQESPRILKLAYLNAYYQTGMKDFLDRSIIDAAADELDVNEIQRDYNKIDEIPFDYNRRRMSVVVANSDRQHGEHLLLTKGAVEAVLAVADQLELGQTTYPLTPSWRRRILADVAKLNDDGLRVLLLAYKRNPAPVGEFSVADEQHLIVVGYLAFLDPVKESAHQALVQLQQAQINTKILTADNEAVARAVGVKVGLNIDVAYSGADFAGKSKAEQDQMLRDCNLFVDLTPTDKLMLIQRLKKQGHTVAYLGSGINDASAMKAADVSFTVEDGVDIAKESAAAILLDKDLEILSQDLQISRQVFTNILKYLKIMLSTSWGNALSLILASLLLPFLPLQPLQLLLLDLICGLSYSCLAHDRVAQRDLDRPARWSLKPLPGFVLLFGPLITICDLITFAILTHYFGPQWWGAYSSLNWLGRQQFTAGFYAGWFLESLCLQELLPHVLRDRRLSLFKQQASWPVYAASLIGIVTGVLLIFTDLHRYLDFLPLPASYLGFILLLLVLYYCLAEICKHFYAHKNNFLL